MYLNVNVLLSLFTFLVSQLQRTADKHDEKARNVQSQIDKLSAEKKVALDEAIRARRVADNIDALLN